MDDKTLKKEKMKTFAILHIILFLYSLGGICSKMAGQNETFSKEFIFYYGLVLLDLAAYAIFWQQILKRIPLMIAYANKAVTVIWGLLWGWVIFNEGITIQKTIGAAVIIIGIVIVVKSDER